LAAHTIEQWTQLPLDGSQSSPLGQPCGHVIFLQEGPAQMPSLQMPEQQFASAEHSWPVPLQAAQVPELQTPLQHWLPVWQLPPGSVQAQALELHIPLQQGLVPHSSPFSEQVASLPEPPPAPPVPAPRKQPFSANSARVKQPRGRRMGDQPPAGAWSETVSSPGLVEAGPKPRGQSQRLARSLKRHVVTG
jgi:hypothetical protein